MIGATAKSEQFFERTGSESTKGSRKGYDLLGMGADPTAVLDDMQREQNLKAALVARKMALDVEYTELTAVVEPGSTANPGYRCWAYKRRREVKKEMMALQQQLTELNAARKQVKESLMVERHFVDVCKESMTKAQFNLLMTQALERAEATIKSC